MKYDFNTKNRKNKVQINTDKWFQPDKNLIGICQISGKTLPTYISQACFVDGNIPDIKEGDIIFMSKVACDVATSPFAQYKIDEIKYFDIPEEQILGIFCDKVDLENLKMRNKNILFKKIKKKQDSTLLIEEKNTMMGEIIKTGNNSSLKKGDIIAVGDNISTPLYDDYYAVEEKFVVGLLNKGLSLKDMDIINEYVLMKPYISKNLLNSTILETPEINYDNLDYSDINNRNLFQVVKADKSMDIKPNDLLIVDRNYTNYMYYSNEKYFTINEKKWISAKIIERDKQCN